MDPTSTAPDDKPAMSVNNEVGYYGKRTFATPRLMIVPTLAGREHRFVFEQTPIRVRLPRSTDAKFLEDEGAEFAPCSSRVGAPPIVNLSTTTFATWM
ncbi:MAG: hypothetical protein ABW110_01170 [Steroidobacteraceae bacterium]